MLGRALARLAGGQPAGCPYQPRRHGDGRDVDELARRDVSVCDPDAMSFRPYPNVDRALAQVARHYPSVSVIELECLRPLADSLAQLRVNARRAAAQGFGLKTDEYRLSTR